MLKAVIFDLGDTLFSAKKARKRAWKEQYKEINRKGYEISREQYEKISKETSQIFDKKYWGDSDRHKPGNFMKMFFDLWGKEAPEKDLKDIGKAYIDTFVETMELMPHAKETLDFCEERNLFLGLITNGTQERAQKLLSKFDLKNYFEIVLPSTEYGEKSTLEPFEVFLEKTEFDPEECLMVGNRLDEDMHAKRVGMKTVWIKKGREKVGKEVEPDFIIEDLLKLKAIIENEIEKHQKRDLNLSG